MIRVIILDTETNKTDSYEIDIESLKKNPRARLIMSNHVDQMVGEFLRDLREQWKEAKP